MNLLPRRPPMTRSFLLLVALLLAAPIGAEETADWYPSRFGADDRIGA